MKPELFSTIAAAISASCALLTIYMYRSQGKGFVWTKDHQVSVITNDAGGVHLQVSIPLFNFGKGNIRFLELKAKKINLESKAMENFQMDMDAAYFPEGVLIIIYTTAIHSDMESKFNTELVVARSGMPQSVVSQECQDALNKKLNEIPEHILILKCKYKNGGWFGLKACETVIGLSVKGINISYLSIARRKELNEYFAL